MSGRPRVPWHVHNCIPVRRWWRRGWTCIACDGWWTYDLTGWPAWGGPLPNTIPEAGR